MHYVAESTTWCIDLENIKKEKKKPFLQLILLVSCPYSTSTTGYSKNKHNWMAYWFLRCSIYHIHPPRASRHRKPFATCHVTLFGRRNRARTFQIGRGDCISIIGKNLTRQHSHISTTTWFHGQLQCLSSPRVVVRNRILVVDINCGLQVPSYAREFAKFWWANNKHFTTTNLHTPNTLPVSNAQYPDTTHLFTDTTPYTVAHHLKVGREIQHAVSDEEWTFALPRPRTRHWPAPRFYRRRESRARRRRMCRLWFWVVWIPVRFLFPLPFCVLYSILFRSWLTDVLACVSHRTQGGIFTTPGDAYTTPVDMWVKALGTSTSTRIHPSIHHYFL